MAPPETNPIGTNSIAGEQRSALEFSAHENLKEEEIKLTPEETMEKIWDSVFDEYECKQLSLESFS